MSIERALADLAQLEAEAQRTRNRLAEMDIQAARLRTYLAVAREYESTKAEQVSATSARSTSHTTGTSNEITVSRQTVNMAVELLRAEGRPMHTRELLAKMALRGLNVGGQNPIANLSGFLSRGKEHLVNSRAIGWSLKEWASAEPPTHASNAEDEASRADPASEVSAKADGPHDDAHGPRDPDMMYETFKDEQDAADYWLE